MVTGIEQEGGWGEEDREIMVEPRASKTKIFDDMMKAFYKVVEGDTSYDISEQEEGRWLHR